MVIAFQMHHHHHLSYSLLAALCIILSDITNVIVLRQIVLTLTSINNDKWRTCIMGRRGWLLGIAYTVFEPLGAILPKSNGRPLPASLPKSPRFARKRCTAFLSQIWTFCPRVTASPCRPSCPKVRI